MEKMEDREVGELWRDWNAVDQNDYEVGHLKDEVLGLIFKLVSEEVERNCCGRDRETATRLVLAQYGIEPATWPSS